MISFKLIFFYFLLAFTLPIYSLFSLPRLDNLYQGDEVEVNIKPSSMNLSFTEENSIIDWKFFSVMENETITFSMPSETSKVLNRVLTPSPSHILGKIESNGTVFLINPQGIIFGESATVNVGSLIASTYNINVADFLANKELIFTGPNANEIVNYGTLQTKSGPLLLIAEKIQNQGLLTSPDNSIAIGGGEKIRLALDSFPYLSVEVAGDVSIENTGKIIAHKIAIQSISHPFALGVSLEGLIEATHIENRGGEIYLCASGNIEIKEDAKLYALDGKVSLDVDSEKVFFLRGDINTSGENGGIISLQTGLLLHEGKLLSHGVNQPGSIEINCDTFVSTKSGIIDTSSINKGGLITINALHSFFSSGTFDVSGAVGGSLHIESAQVSLAAASLLAKGIQTGGNISISSHSFQKPLYISEQSNFSVACEDTTKSGSIFLFSPYLIENFGRSPSCQEEGHLQIAPCSTMQCEKPKVGSAEHFFRFTDPNPTSANSSFGKIITPLKNNGNVVVTKPLDSMGGRQAGAVFTFDGKTGALLSTFLGAYPNDQIGSGGIIPLTNGNFIIISPRAHLQVGKVVGALSWRHGTDTKDAIISHSNSHFATSPEDFQKIQSAALTNGNFVISFPNWNEKRGAIVWINGTTGKNVNNLFGQICEENAHVGIRKGDRVGSSCVVALPNGNCFVGSPFWNRNKGAATFINGLNGKNSLENISTISTQNSITGSFSKDEVGTAIIPLANGNVLISSPNWNNEKGAVTWASGETGQTFEGEFTSVSAKNSLVGSFHGDHIGSAGVIALHNNNAIILSPNWQNKRGAITWVCGINGSDIYSLYGFVSEDNSIIGMKDTMDQAGSGGGVALANGCALVSSPMWDCSKGAVTWIDGFTGKDALGCFGHISAFNSIVGSEYGDRIGSGGAIAFSANGNGAVISPHWSQNKGSVTWINGKTGTDIHGAFNKVSERNSIVGSLQGDLIGSGGTVALARGNGVISSPKWKNGAGAATWINGDSGYHALGSVGFISASNSLIGTKNSDQISSKGIVPLSDGNFFVTSDKWDSSVSIETGALTFGSGKTGDFSGTFGPVQKTNSITGIASLSALSYGVDNPAASTFITLFNNENGSPTIFALGYFNAIPPVIEQIESKVTVQYLIALSEQLARTNPIPLTGYFPPDRDTKNYQVILPLSIINTKTWKKPTIVHE